MKLRSAALMALLPLFCAAQISQIEVVPVVEKKVKTQDVVFDCSSSNKKFIASRLWLIDMSIKEYVTNGTPYHVVLTIHSGCTDIVSENIDDDKIMNDIHKKLEILSKYENVSIEACQIAVDNFGIEYDELHPFITLVPNSITRVISLQNDGYAFIPFSR